jgi:hypothetical protein
VRYGNRDIFHLYQVFQIDLAGILDNLGAPRVAEFLLDFLQLFDDEIAQNFFRAQNFQVRISRYSEMRR